MFLTALKILGAICIGGATAYAVKKAYESYSDLESKRLEIDNDIRKYNEEVKRHLSIAHTETHFRELCQLHHTSHMTSGRAYSEYVNAKSHDVDMAIAIDAVYDKIKKEKAKLKTTDSNERQSATSRISNLYEAANELKKQREVTKQAKKHFLDNLRKLNENTRALKIKIRDETGDGGREWYRRLEERRATKRLAS